MDEIIFKISQEKGLSDIHFQTGKPIAIRINGSIIKQENNSISKEQISKFISEDYDLILTERKLRKHSLYMIILTFLYNKLIAILVKKRLKNY